MPALALTAWFFRKRFLIFALLVGAFAGSSLGEPVFFTVSKTPYDHQMVRVGFTLVSRATEGSGSISSLALNQWMTELRAIPYHYSKYWQTPAEVGDAEATDCKGKALALYAKMRQSGARNLWLVIGKHHIYDSVTHAWLEWETTAGTFVVDPTFNEIPVRTAELDPMIYLPIYAYDGIHKYRVSNAGYFAPTTRVASGVNDRGRLPRINPATLALSGLAGARPSTSPILLAKSTTYLPVRSESRQPSPSMGYSDAPRSIATNRSVLARSKRAGRR
jgi:hypothetical protein